MKKSVEDFLHILDKSMQDKSTKEINMIYIMIFSIIFVFSYIFLWESSETLFSKKTQEINTIETQIDADNIFLQYNPEIKISKLESEIKKAKEELLFHKDNNAYIKNKIEAISSLIYDERSWGEYLNSISMNAEENNIKIIYFTNEYAKKNQSFGHVLDINLKVTGNYKNTLKFINSLEQSKLVVDIHNLNMYIDDTLNTDLNISVWGITY